jgi:hypothetical protein
MHALAKPSVRAQVEPAAPLRTIGDEERLVIRDLLFMGQPLSR